MLVVEWYCPYCEESSTDEDTIRAHIEDTHSCIAAPWHQAPSEEPVYNADTTVEP